MSTEIKPFNPSDVVTTVRDAIRDKFVSLIPAEVFTRMVQSEIDNFMKPKEDGYGGGKRYRTDFARVVNDELIEATKKEVQKVLAGPKWSSCWTGDGEQASAAVQAAMIENAPQILNAAVGSLFQNAISRMRS